MSKAAERSARLSRADVERVLRIKHLLFVEGLTLAGARRRLIDEGVTTPEAGEAVEDADVAAMIDQETRQQLRDVRRGLQWILGVLSGQGTAAEDFVLGGSRLAEAGASAASVASVASLRQWHRADRAPRDRAWLARPHRGPQPGSPRRRPTGNLRVRSAGDSRSRLQRDCRRVRVRDRVQAGPNQFMDTNKPLRLALRTAIATFLFFVAMTAALPWVFQLLRF